VNYKLSTQSYRDRANLHLDAKVLATLLAFDGREVGDDIGGTTNLKRYALIQSLLS
jgi:hypothetical protein